MEGDDIIGLCLCFKYSDKEKVVKVTCCTQSTKSLLKVCVETGWQVPPTVLGTGDTRTEIRPFLSPRGADI